MLSTVDIGITLGVWQALTLNSRVAQWKRAGPITQRSVDRNYALLSTFLQQSSPISAEDSALDF